MEGEQFGDKFDSTYNPPFWYGLVNTVLATSFLTLDILTVVAIRLHENFPKWMSYQIIFFISLCDIAQLTGHVCSGVSLMLEWEMPYLLNIFIGSIMSGAWISSSIYGILLAVHRLFSVVYPLYELRYFTGRSKTTIFSFAHSTIPFFIILKWIGPLRYKFHLELFSWHYDKSFVLGEISSVIDDYSVVPFILCSFVCYSMIFYTIETKGDTRECPAITAVSTP
ncbi:unnamed protein product [Angiostrongylus costaricensis]|uniref:Serpentine Receptor, class T n=1 Tax=Angiostrongylus costaricensis TaxID=334426 RepID=A0A158PJH1_ANGCS|nr:unnamed protein product [Angiostrongylus costaricensis]